MEPGPVVLEVADLIVDHPLLLGERRVDRVSFSVTAEMACSPLDLPMEFVAEVDVGSGKIQLTRLPIST